LNLIVVLNVALNGRTHARGLQILAMHQHQEVLCFVIDMVVSRSDLAKDKEVICNRIWNPHVKPAKLGVLVLMHLSSPQSPVVQHCSSGHAALWKKLIWIIDGCSTMLLDVSFNLSQISGHLAQCVKSYVKTRGPVCVNT
jgi:hypothetical protein